MITGGIKVIGNTKAIDALALKGALIGDIAMGLYIIAERIMTDSKDNYVPVDTGALMRSGTVLEPKMTSAGGVSVTFGYGEEYARIVHDRPPSIGQGKVRYLEIPFLAAIPGAEKQLTQIVSKAIQTVMKTKRPTGRDGWKAHQGQRAQTKRVDSGASG
jgi:hypothetical protein